MSIRLYAVFSELQVRQFPEESRNGGPTYCG